MDNEKTLALTLVENLIEMTCRAVRAEDALVETTKYKDIFRDASARKDSEIDALKKEVEKLRAKLNTMEGLEAADRGLL